MEEGWNLWLPPYRYQVHGWADAQAGGRADCDVCGPGIGYWAVVVHWRGKQTGVDMKNSMSGSRKIHGLTPGQYYDRVMAIVEPKLTDEQICSIHFNYYTGTWHGNFWVGSQPNDPLELQADLISSTDICADGVEPAAWRLLKHFGIELDLS